MTPTPPVGFADSPLTRGPIKVLTAAIRQKLEANS